MHKSVCPASDNRRRNQSNQPAPYASWPQEWCLGSSLPKLHQSLEVDWLRAWIDRLKPLLRQRCAWMIGGQSQRSRLLSISMISIVASCCKTSVGSSETIPGITYLPISPAVPASARNTLKCPKVAHINQMCNATPMSILGSWRGVIYYPRWSKLICTTSADSGTAKARASLTSDWMG